MSRRVCFEVVPHRTDGWTVARHAEAESGLIQSRYYGRYRTRAEAEDEMARMAERRAWQEAAHAVGAQLQLDSAGQLHAVDVAPGSSVRVERCPGGARVSVERDGATWTGEILGNRR